jgi:lipopolysaccharide biosynthesis regulator YciM
MKWGEAALILSGAIVGWYATRRARIDMGAPKKGPSSDYLAGLNFLVNEQPDRAVEAFLRAVAVEPDTVETQFALGALFRRRGEVDRAIRVHQNLVERTELAPAFKEQATYALAQDYLKAGLFDRAEKLLSDLSRGGAYRLPALKDLVVIYELEREWAKAIEMHEELARSGRPDQAIALAHYRCELADVARREKDFEGAKALIKQARSGPRQFPRAALVRADVALDEGDAELALTLLRRVPVESPQLASEVLPRLVRALKLLGQEDALPTVLAQLAGDGHEVSDAIAHAAILAGATESPALLDVLRGYYTREPAIAELVQALSADRSPDDAAVRALAQALRRQAQKIARYRCGDCGFSSSAFFWQCPGCKSWDTLKPLGPGEQGGALSGPRL